MPRFIALVTLSPTAHEDLTNGRHRFRVAADYLERREIRVENTFLLEGTQHLFVLDAPESPTRYLNRALARAWPEPDERPGMARVVHAEPWIRRPDLAHRGDELGPRRDRRPRPPARRELAAG
jgi:hypothetical protein